MTRTSADETTHLLGAEATAEGGEEREQEQESGEWDESSTGTVRNGKGKGKFALWQVGAFFGILLAYADTSLVWATHETVASHFDNLANSSWIMTSFAIGYCVTLPLYGRLSDNYGRLRPLIAAYCTFCVGCIFCGAGQTYWQVILGRIIIGCGASGIISLASIIITDIAAPSDVAVLRSYVNVASTIGLSVGGPLGGFLGGTIGWRWSFLGQVPIALICLVLISHGLRHVLPALEDDEETQRIESASHELKPTAKSFDYPGAFTLAIWISSLLSVIDLQNQLSWGDPLVLCLIVAGVLALGAFLALETWPGDRELLIPLKLLRTQVGAFCAGAILIVGSCHGFVSQIAPYFANTQGTSDAQGGLLTIPSSVGNALGNLIAGRVIKRFGSYKNLSISSLLLCIACSSVIFFQWGHFINQWQSLVTFPFGLFAGIVLSTQFIGLYICAPKQYMATAISMYYMSQQIGIAIGISLCSSLLKERFESSLVGVLGSLEGGLEIIRRILIDSSHVNLLPDEIKAMIAKSYLDSFWVVPALVIGAQVLALLPMVFVREKRDE